MSEKTAVSGKEFDPETETDPLIRRHITRDARGDAVFREYHFPVWTAIMSWRQKDRDWERVHEWYDDIPLETLRVAERFAERYPDEIEEYLREREAYSR